MTTFPAVSLDSAQAYFREDIFRKGLAYYREGRVRQTLRCGHRLFAQVHGSASRPYRVMLTFDGRPAARCTCPAARRHPLCKHAAAALAAWASAPETFVAAAQPPDWQPPDSRRAAVKTGQSAATPLMTAGLDAVNALTTELLLSGLAAITTDRVAQIWDLAENLRSYRLRRLATLVMRLADELTRLRADTGDAASLSRYTRLLSEIALTAQGVRGILAGARQDPRYMEELVGKTWGKRSLPPRYGLQLLEVWFEAVATVDGFTVWTSYFVELGSGEILTEKLIQPRHLKTGNAAKRSYAGLTLLVDKGLQYPGFPPFRLALSAYDERPATAHDCARLAAHAIRDFSSLANEFKTFRKDLFAPDAMYALIGPAGLYASEAGLSAFDPDGAAFELALTTPAALWMQERAERSAIDALFGRLFVQDGRFRFAPYSVLRHSAAEPYGILETMRNNIFY